MNRFGLVCVFLAATAIPAAAETLSVQVLDNGTVIDSLSGITTGTFSLTTSDAAFSSITANGQGSPVLPGGDLSTVTLDATSALGGAHTLTLNIFQDGISVPAGSVSSTFTINGLIGGPGPTTETTYQGGSSSTLGTQIASHTFAVGDVTDSFGPVTNATPAFTADAESYNIAFTAADQSFGGSIQLVTGAVPEPSTWAMLLTGFGFIGFLACRRKGTSRRFRMRAG